MDLAATITEFSQSILHAVFFAIGGAIAFAILSLFITDYLRKRAAENRKIWKNL